MQPNFPIAAQVRERFEEVLHRILDGEWDGCPTDTWLNDDTMQALNVVAIAVGSGRAVEAATAVARKALDEMLDGTAARRQQEERIEFARQYDAQREAQRQLDLEGQRPTTE